MIVNEAFFAQLAGATLADLDYSAEIAEMGRRNAATDDERDEFTKAGIAILLEIRGRMTPIQRLLHRRDAAMAV